MWNYHQAVGTEISKAQARVCNNAPSGWKRGEHTWEVTMQNIQSVSGRSLKKLGSRLPLGRGARNRGEKETCTMQTSAPSEF